MSDDRYGIAIFWSDEDDAWIAIPPDLDGCSAFGDTPEEALRELQIAKRLWLEVGDERGYPPPEPEWLPETARDRFGQEPRGGEEYRSEDSDQSEGPYPPLVHVTSVEVLHDFVVRLSFDDGATIERDLDELLQGPVFEPLRNDPELFRQVRVELGTIVWPNEADIDPVVLRGFAEPAWKEDEESRAG